MPPKPKPKKDGEEGHTEAPGSPERQPREENANQT